MTHSRGISPHSASGMAGRTALHIIIIAFGIPDCKMQFALSGTEAVPGVEPGTASAFQETVTAGPRGSVPSRNRSRAEAKLPPDRKMTERLPKESCSSRTAVMRPLAS